MSWTNKPIPPALFDPERFNQDRIHLSRALIRMAKWRDLCLDRIAALREENARLREVLSYARAILPMEKWADSTKGMIDAALAAHAPEPKGESREEALREAMEECVAAYDWPAPNCTMEKAIERARSLLARKPAEERWPEVGE